MRNAIIFACRLLMLATLVALFCVGRAQAQSWTVQSDSGSPVEVDHNPDGSWTVTPQGGASATYGADDAGSMVNDYGISSGDFSSMQSQAQSHDDSGDGSSAGASPSSSDDDDGGGTASGQSGSGDDDNSMSGQSSGSDDDSGASSDSGGGDESGGGGGESGGGDSGGSGDSGD